MTDWKSLANEDIPELLADPNPTGVFVGGPPLLSPKQASYIRDHAFADGGEAMDEVQKIFTSYLQEKKSAGTP